MTLLSSWCFFFNDTATTEIYTLSLHDGSSDLSKNRSARRRRSCSPCHCWWGCPVPMAAGPRCRSRSATTWASPRRSEEHTSELQSPDHLVCRLLLEKKKSETNRRATAYSPSTH